MSQTKQQGIQKRLTAWLSRRKPENYSVVLIVTLFIAVYFFAVYGKETFLSFIISWSAGILGIMAGFTLDRKREEIKDDRVKKDFLVLMRDELTEIKSKIPPQKKIPVMLYPEVWDSFVASGLMRLLSAEQVTKLSSVYRFVKDFQYETEWLRQIEEETSTLSDLVDTKQLLKERHKRLEEKYIRNGTRLSEEIDKIIEEKW